MDNLEESNRRLRILEAFPVQVADKIAGFIKTRGVRTYGR